MNIWWVRAVTVYCIAMGAYCLFACTAPGFDPKGGQIVAVIAGMVALAGGPLLVRRLRAPPRVPERVMVLPAMELPEPQPDRSKAAA